MYAMKTIADQLDPTAMQISKRGTLLKLIDEDNDSHFTKAWTSVGARSPTIRCLPWPQAREADPAGEADGDP